jgi:hypothetical protein
MFELYGHRVAPQCVPAPFHGLPDAFDEIGSRAEPERVTPRGSRPVNGEAG